MTKQHEPIEPTEVYDSTRRSTSDRLRSAAGQVIAGGTRIKDTVTTSMQSGAESARTTAGDLADQPAAKLREYSDRARSEGARLGDRARTRAGRAAAPGGAVDWTEEKLNGLLAGIGHRIDDAVRAGKIDRAFQFAQEGVSKGAGQARRLLRR
ncbi:hypothetical protein GCM10022261_30890 [Brevibacterium daeguense]|uniref:Excreted virulence factor EspC (Type VII ESX diderm) n=1 Tax=Brevibacterium daeguense TaxID=909936 RepID=A0ABP8ENI2_9MICO|nr:hypothetical protein [Brevibacterium daeguense]